MTVNPDHIDLAVSGMAGPGDRAVRLDYVIAVDPIISERIGVTDRPFLHGAVGGEDRRRSETSLRRFVRNESGCKRRGVIGRTRIAGGVFPGGARFGVAVGTEEDVLVELEIPNQYTGPKKIGVVVSLRHEGIVARIRVHGKSQPKLFLVAFAGGGSGAVACLIQRRQQHRCQNRNDCNHNQYIYLMVYFWGNTPIVMILEFIDHYCRLGKRGLQDESHYILQTIFWR